MVLHTFMLLLPQAKFSLVFSLQIDALVEVSAAVQDKVEVYMDGGIRTGSDILKALALGAKCVFIGRPALWGLAYKVSRYRDCVHFSASEGLASGNSKLQMNDAPLERPTKSDLLSFLHLQLLNLIFHLVLCYMHA